MDNQLTINNRRHNTTGTPLSNKMMTTTRGTKTLEGNTHLHLRKQQQQGATSRKEIEEILKYVENVDKNTRDKKQLNMVKPKKHMTMR